VSQRERILSAARAIALEEGSEALSMRRVASRLGVTATSLYRHFENREAILREVVAEGRAAFAEYLRTSLRGRTPQRRFWSAYDAYLAFAIERPAHYEALFFHHLGGEEVTHSQETFQLLVERVRECIDAGYFRAGDPMKLATTLWVHAHGLASLYLVGRFGSDAAQFKKLARESMQLILEGVAA